MRRPRRIEPKPGQESVWDYPRPPRVDDSDKHVVVTFNGVRIADTHRARRMLETSSPPVFYIPPEDVALEFLRPTERASFCEWKGRAAYHTITVGDRSAADAAWSYPRPTPDFGSIAGYLAFYPSQMDACLVDEEPVRAQPGDFYGGWITGDIVGPFKGDRGTEGW